LVGVVALLASGGCDLSFFPDAIVTSQNAYDFGLSEFPWVFEVWTDNANVDTLRFSVTSNRKWIVVDPENGISTGPDDRRAVSVTIDRTNLREGEYEGTISVSAFGFQTQEIVITAKSDGSMTSRLMQITNVARSYTAPYLLDFTFSLRNAAKRPIVAEPAQFDVACLEGGEEISTSETGAQLSKAANKQLKAVLVLDYTASMADLANGDVDEDGKSDAIQAMENAAKYVFLPSLTEDAQVAVYEFHRDRDPAMVCDFTVDKEYVRDAIDTIWTQHVGRFPGTSRCWDAVFSAVTAFGGESQMDESRNVIFLSDGRDESSTTTPRSIVNKAGDLGVRVYAIGFGRELDITALQLITQQTQGDFYPAETADDMPKMFENIVRDLDGQYTLRWTTLKRGDAAFTPAFIIEGGDLRALYKSPVDYVPSTFAGDTLKGTLRVVPSQSNLQTTLFLRSVYMPRYVRTIRLYVRTPYPFIVRKVDTAEGGLCGYWPMTVTDDPDVGGTWIELVSPDPDNIFSGLDYGAFGPIIRFDFDEILPTDVPPFEQISLDNTPYEGGQYLSVEGYPQAPVPAG